jgi:IclR family transcriptional regulator, acetate operon repressor
VAAGAGKPTLISSVQRALRLLEAVSCHDEGATAKVLAHETGLRLPTTYHLIRTLVHEGYLQRLPGGRYLVGERVDQLRRPGSVQSLVSKSRSALESLRDELRVPVYLALYDDGEISIVDIVDSARAPRADLWVGIHDAAHATALGKCVLRALSQDARRDYVSRHPLPDLTPRTITRRDVLLRSLECAPADGPVLEQSEYALGTTCAAVPVGDGRRVGALAVSASLERLPELSGFAEPLEATAGRVSRALALSS